MTDPYDAFSVDYHWIHPDEAVSGRRFLDQYAPVLDALPPDAEVLDCACGPGFDAMALARRGGLRVTASDASKGMVERALASVTAAGLDVALACCRWDELPATFGPSRFDAVFCVGNSIAHCEGPAAMTDALTGMRTVLRPGGVLVVESRDWEAVRAERRRFEVRDHMAERDGARGCCLYVWTIPETWDEPHVAEIVVLVEREGHVAHRVVELRFAPYRWTELLDRIAAAGLMVEDVRPGLPGRYVVVSRPAE